MIFMNKLLIVLIISLLFVPFVFASVAPIEFSIFLFNGLLNLSLIGFLFFVGLFLLLKILNHFKFIPVESETDLKLAFKLLFWLIVGCFIVFSIFSGLTILVLYHII